VERNLTVFIFNLGLQWVAHFRINTSTSGFFVHCGAILLGERLVRALVIKHGHAMPFIFVNYNG